jgi:hypothetical protein
MRLGTPRAEQGQTVEHSYGWEDGTLYRRTADGSDRTVAWHCADRTSAARLAEEDWDAGSAADAPAVVTWSTCDGPER